MIMTEKEMDEQLEMLQDRESFSIENTNNPTNIFAPNKQFDVINNPSHYADSEIEPIEIIEDWHLGFCLGNAIKYIKRNGHKKSAALTDRDKAIQDLKKACWYILRRVYQLEGKKDKYAICKKEKILKEIENNMEDITGKYDASTPKSETPICIMERNKVRQEIIDIILNNS